jgi:hypothetical protein
MSSQKTIDAPKKYAPLLWLLRVYAFNLVAVLVVVILIRLFNLLAGEKILLSWERLMADLGLVLGFPIVLPVGASYISPLGAVSLLGILFVGVVRESRQPGKLFLNKGFGFPEWLLLAGVLGTLVFAVFWTTRVDGYISVYLAACCYWLVNLLFVWWMTRRQLNRLA